MINVSGLTKHYGPTVAVGGLTFTIPPGHVTGFLGPNGAGKTTTISPWARSCGTPPARSPRPSD